MGEERFNQVLRGNFSYKGWWLYGMSCSRVAEAGIIMFKKHLNRFIDRKGLEGYGTSSGWHLGQ